MVKTSMFAHVDGGSNENDQHQIIISEFEKFINDCFIISVIIAVLGLIVFACLLFMTFRLQILHRIGLSSPIYFPSPIVSHRDIRRFKSGGNDDTIYRSTTTTEK